MSYHISIISLGLDSDRESGGSRDGDNHGRVTDVTKKKHALSHFVYTFHVEIFHREN